MRQCLISTFLLISNIKTQKYKKLYNFSTLFFGKPFIYLPECLSTNEYALQMLSDKNAERALFDGTLIITDNQTAGKGQAGNTWDTNPNENITLSLVLKPHFLDANEQFWLNMVVALGIFDFVSSKINNLVKIKWSNDIFIADKKVGGILIQNILSGKNINYSIIGIGLNINQLNFNIPAATSLLLASADANTYNVRVCVEELLSYLEKRYFQLKENKKALIKFEYLQNMYRYQEKAMFEDVEGTFEGEIIGVDEIGKLCIKKNNRLQYYHFKEVKFSF